MLIVNIVAVSALGQVPKSLLRHHESPISNDAVSQLMHKDHEAKQKKLNSNLNGKRHLVASADSTGPIVRQEFEEGSTIQNPETIDENFKLINNFLLGAQMWTFLPNSIDCSFYAQVFLNEANATNIYF